MSIDWFWENPVIMEQLQVLFFILPFILSTWWFFIRRAFRSIKSHVPVKRRLQVIYSEPLSAALHTCTVIICITALVIAAFR